MLLVDINPYARVYRSASERMRRNDDLTVVLRGDLGADPRRYNNPTDNHIAAITPNNEYVRQAREIVLNTRDGRLHRISELHHSYVPLQYPLLFPRGESGWYMNMRNLENKKVSFRDWAASMLQIRQNEVGNSLLHLSGRLFHQFAVDMYVAIETQRLLYLRQNQLALRADRYSDVVAYMDEDVQTLTHSRCCMPPLKNT